MAAGEDSHDEHNSAGNCNLTIAPTGSRSISHALVTAGRQIKLIYAQRLLSIHQSPWTEKSQLTLA